MTKANQGGLQIVAPAKILFIDAYDSFSNNIKALIERKLDVEIVKIFIDDPRFVDDEPAFYKFLQNFDAVIAGPGPGTADNSKDVGLIAKLWTQRGDRIRPVLGICLGFQSLGVSFGATIERLVNPRHGIVTDIDLSENSLFDGVADAKVTHYHSLQVNIGHRYQVSRRVSFPKEVWVPSSTCPELLPLAWDSSDLENGPILMAIRHKDKPFWGVQFHPESICTSVNMAGIIDNWWAEVGRGYPSRYRGAVDAQLLRSPLARPAPEKLEQLTIISSPTVDWKYTGLGQLSVRDIYTILTIPAAEAIILESAYSPTSMKEGTGRYSIICCINDGNYKFFYFSGQKRFEMHRDNEIFSTSTNDPWAYLQTQMAHGVSGGAADVPFWGGLVGYINYEACLDTIGVSHSASNSLDRPDISFAWVRRSVVVDHKLKKVTVQTIRPDDEKWLEETHNKVYQAVQSGGRYIIKPHIPRDTFPDLRNFVDNECDSSNLRQWAGEMMRNHYLKDSVIAGLKKEEYVARVKACQEAIRAGNSYEVCLTNTRRVFVPYAPEPVGLSWLLYENLREKNPAPFGAYIRLRNHGVGVTVMSSSPERFLCWDRSGHAQYRPIKGTLAVGPNVGRRDAELYFQSCKERAENLMIVDLIRHDLHGVEGVTDVRVPKLFNVEEYETVFQLVSVIEGNLGSGGSSGLPATTPSPCASPYSPCYSSTSEDYFSTPSQLQPPAEVPLNSQRENIMMRGIDVLRTSLPPGSMTGAPKRRTCELLQSFEKSKHRGIYSGIIGYLDVGGGADFAVAIRTAYGYDDERITQKLTRYEPLDFGPEDERWKEFWANPTAFPHKAISEEIKSNIWHIGAGGAVTSLSEPEAEYEEMVLKANSVLRAFTAEETKEYHAWVKERNCIKWDEENESV